MASREESREKEENLQQIEKAYKEIKQRATEELIANREQEEPMKKMSAELESIRF